MPETNLPPPRSESYQKARKSYGLVAGLLLAWELVGVELQSSNLPFSLQSPDAAPLVLLALVVYFGFRFAIEWRHHHPARREDRWSRIDNYLAHIIGFGAVAVFFIQLAIDEQLFDVVVSDEPRPLIVFAGGVLLGSAPTVYCVGKLLKKRFYRVSSALTGLFGCATILIGVTVRSGPAPSSTLAISTGAGLGIGLSLSLVNRLAIRSGAGSR